MLDPEPKSAEHYATLRHAQFQDKLSLNHFFIIIHEY